MVPQFNWKHFFFLTNKIMAHLLIDGIVDLIFKNSIGRAVLWKRDETPILYDVEEEELGTNARSYGKPSGR